MNKIRENLYLGSWEPASNLAELQAHGITAVLNVALEQADPDFFNEGITSIKIGLGDCPFNKPHVKELAVSTLAALLDAGEVVFVHCVAGASRSPYVISKYLMKKENRTLDDVMTELVALRPQVFARSPLHAE